MCAEAFESLESLDFFPRDFHPFGTCPAFPPPSSQQSQLLCPDQPQLWQVLQNSCPYTTYPTFSFPPMEDPISPLTNSSLHRTNTRTHPHSSPMPRASEARPVPIHRYVFLFHPFRLDPCRSSTGPSVRWSLFSSSYVFLFRFRSRSAFATQHQSSVPFPLSTSYDSLSRFLIGPALW